MDGNEKSYIMHSPLCISLAVPAILVGVALPCETPQIDPRADPPSCG